MNIFRNFKKYSQFQQLLKQLGAGNAFLYIFNRLSKKIGSPAIFNKYYFVVQSLSSYPFLPLGKGKQFLVEEIGSQFSGQHPCARPIAVIQDRYQQGAVCLAAYKGQEFAGCLWYIKQRYLEDEVRCLYELPSPGVVWDFDVYVEPKYRLTSVFLKLWDSACSGLVREGCHWSMSRISAFNAMSLSSHKRMGAKVIGSATFLQVGNLQVCFASIKPFFHISFSDNSIPVFRLQLPNF